MERVLITGIGSGLGEALAAVYLERGFEVYALSRHLPESLEGHERLHFERCDLRALEEIEFHLSHLLRGVDRIDLAILNAGILHAIKDMVETKLWEFEEAMAVNVWANKVILDHFLRHRIPLSQAVAISSGAAVNCNRGWNDYSLSKAALNALIKLYAREMEGTHLTALAPGIVMTPMLRKVIETVDVERYPSVKRIRETPKMTPREAAERLFEVIPTLKRYESGAFLDVRKL